MNLDCLILMLVKCLIYVKRVQDDIESFTNVQRGFSMFT